MGSIPGSGRSPGGGHGSPVQCSCLDNPMGRGAWGDMVCGVTRLHSEGSGPAGMSQVQGQQLPREQGGALAAAAHSILGSPGSSSRGSYGGAGTQTRPLTVVFRLRQ